jgi:hypothetical protein
MFNAIQPERKAASSRVYRCGYVQQNREEMEALFPLLADRGEQGGVPLTSNFPVLRYEQIFKGDENGGDDRLRRRVPTRLARRPKPPGRITHGAGPGQEQLCPASTELGVHFAEGRAAYGRMSAKRPIWRTQSLALG